MIYDGADLRDYFHVGFDRALLPPVEVSTVEVSGRDGALFQRTRLMPLEITAFLRWKKAKASAVPDLRRLAASLLYRDEPRPLVLPDEPDKHYLAVVSGHTALDSLGKNGKAYVTFMCPDPVAFGQTRTCAMATQAEGHVGGTYRTAPTFACRPARGSYYKVTNEATGEFVQVNASFTGDQSLVIDCARQQTTLNGVNYPVTFASDYFSFEPGPFSVRASSGTAEMSWTERWL